MTRIAPLCVAALLSGCAEHLYSPDARSFDWLAGCWQLERENGGAYEEQWMPITNDGTIGTAREVKNGLTLSYEFQRIELRKDGSAVYFAQPSGQDMTGFRMTAHAPGSLVFENPEHDWPSRIEYQLVDVNAIVARVSGPQGAGTRTAEYPMKRIDCQ